MGKKIAVLVVGMGRSGSSAMTRVLSIVGAKLPVDIMPANSGNPLGYWEPQAIVDVNDAFLRLNGSSWYDASTRMQNMSVRDAKGVTTFYRSAKRCLLEQFADSPFIVIKDPRISGMLPIWLRILTSLDYSVRFVHIFRSLPEVAASLAKRDGLHYSESEALWLKYNVLAEIGSRGFQRIFVHFDDLIRDWRSVCRDIATQLDISDMRFEKEKDVDNFLRKDLVKSNKVQTDGISLKVYNCLIDAAASKMTNFRLFDRIASEALANGSYYSESLAAIELS